MKVALPDGSERELADQASAADLAAQIGPGLAKSAVAAKVDGKVVDLSRPLHDGAQVAIITQRDAEGLEVLRHSAAHLMADAILRVFPQAQLTIGPVVENGFYYDIYLPEGQISSDDFPKIEKEMEQIAKAKLPFERRVAKQGKADEVFLRYRAIDGGENKFKEEIVEQVLGRGDELSFYAHGDFVDLCRGPHVPDTGWLKHVKLTNVSGAYWRGDANREQLVRVYGTAFFDKKALKQYLHMLEEAKKRDHRVIGEKLSLFTFSEEAPGFPIFLPHGAVIFNVLVDTMRDMLRQRGYQEVKTPLVLSEKLWHTSGHYDNYLENMFFTKLKLRNPEHPDEIKDNVEESRPLAVKPMNCPGHCVLYKSRLHSHNEFPLRIAEMGLVHRRELSGTRHGLFRVQAFTQDDAHHFCTPEQIGGEVVMLIQFFQEVYGLFGLSDVRVELSTRPEKSIGSDAMWERAESALKQAIENSGMPYELNPGDGAFYGPKLDFHIRDVLGRSWQCGTIQLDFSMPDRFGLTYVGADGERHTPVMLHRACYGSLERFMGIVIENFAGKFPTWLSPVQAQVIPVSDKFNAYAESVIAQLQAAGLRVEGNLSSDRVGRKIALANEARLPYMLVVGEREQEEGTVSVRGRDKEDLGALSVAGFLEAIAAELRPGGGVAAAAAS
ncbi:MAG: threonine--tRNA ligase [Planctomycetota bacterium]